MYNTDKLGCDAVPAATTVYENHKTAMNELHNSVNMLEAQLSKVLLKADNDKAVNEIKNVTVPVRSELKSWIAEQTADVDAAYQRIMDILRRLDI